jgi:hypothetical protein
MFSGGTGMTERFLNLMLDPAQSDMRLAVGSAYSCAVLADVKPNATLGLTPSRYATACKRLVASDMYAFWTKKDPSWASAQVMPTWPIYRSAEFYTEVTDPAYSQSVPGYAISAGPGTTPACFVTVEVTSAGITKPSNSTVGAETCSDVGTERLRTFMTAGPVTGANCQ